VRTAVINKRAGGMGLISGRKAFQKPLSDGIQLLESVQLARLGRIFDFGKTRQLNRLPTRPFDIELSELGCFSREMRQCE